VVRAAEDAPGDQRLVGGEHPGDRVDLGGFQRFGEARLGEDGRQAPGEHGLAAPGGPTISRLCPPAAATSRARLTCCCPQTSAKSTSSPAAARKQGRYVDPAWLQMTVGGEKIDHLPEGGDRINRQAIDQRPSSALTAGTTSPFESASAGRPPPPAAGRAPP